MRHYYFHALMFMVLLSACSKPDQKISEEKTSFKKVQLDLSTPDKALKSYWAAFDAANFNTTIVRKKHLSDFNSANSQLALVQSKAIYEERYSISMVSEIYSRDILEVKVESESRAVIEAQIKNTTPNPPGVELEDWQKRQRDEGERYKYILEKNNNGWIVTEIWRWSEYFKEWNKYSPDEKPEIFSIPYP